MDKRAETTKVVKDSICEALLYLMKTTPFDKIKITEIISKAGVARASYYRNFTSKENILEHCVELIMKDYYDNYGKLMKLDSYENILYTSKYFYKYKDQLNLIIKAGLYTSVIKILTSINHYPIFNKKPVNKEQTYYYAIFSGSLCTLLTTWITNGCVESAEEISMIFYNIWNKKNINN